MGNITANWCKHKVGALWEQARDTTADVGILLLIQAGVQTDDALADHTTLSAMLAATNDEATFTNYCVDPATECMTRRLGWTTVDRMVPGDEILAYDPGSHVTRWEQPTEVFVNRDYAGDMWNLSMRGFSAFTTPGHRWPVADRSRRPGGVEVWSTETLPARGRELLRSAPFDGPDEAVYTDAFVRIAAWYFTEGNLTRDGQRISISQSGTHNAIHVEDIRNDVKAIGALAPEPATSCNRGGCSEPPLLRRMCRNHYQSENRAERRRGESRGSRGRDRNTGLIVKERVRSRDGLVTWDLSGYRVDEITKCIQGSRKVPTMEFLTALTTAQARIFVDTCIAGDGSPEWRRFDQHDADRMDAFTVAAVLSGAGPTLGDDGTSCHLNEAAPYVRLANVRREQFRYSGTVWCPVVPSGHWVARRAGKVHITGNSRKILAAPTVTVNNVLNQVPMTATGPFSWPAAGVAGGGTTGNNTLIRAVIYFDPTPGTSTDVTRQPISYHDIFAVTDGNELLITPHVDGIVRARNV